MQFMTVLALAKSYKDANDTSEDTGDGDSKSSLNGGLARHERNFTDFVQNLLIKTSL